jgi:ketosteroid isomerase-like protein
MSEENMATLQRAQLAWNAEDLDAWLAELDPEAEWHTALEQALEGRGSTYRGHDDLRQAWDEYRSKTWGGLTNQIQEVRDLGESALVLGHLDFTSRTFGIESAQEFGQLVTLRAGKILRTDDFLTHRDALEAAGLSE